MIERLWLNFLWWWKVERGFGIVLFPAGILAAATVLGGIAWMIKTFFGPEKIMYGFHILLVGGPVLVGVIWIIGLWIKAGLRHD